MRTSVVFLLALSMSVTTLTAADRPSREPEKGCKWEKLTDPALGLEAWVERCDFGYRKVDLFVKGKSLDIRYSDGGAPEAMIDVIDLQAGETPEAGLKRVFAAHTKKDVAKRCVLAPFKGEPVRSDVKRMTFVPNAAFQKELDKKNAVEGSDGDIPEPPCGDFGDSPDGIQYFEVQPGAPRVLFVRVGQDIPLFDEQTLKVLPLK